MKCKLKTITLTSLICFIIYIGCGKENDESGFKSYTPPPPDVKYFSMTPMDERGQVILTWADPTDVNFDHIEITINGTKLYTVAKGVQTYKVSGLREDTAYIFTIKTVDKAGNKSKGISYI